jgi:muramoyltetrapeptide carboxypeptidase
MTISYNDHLLLKYPVGLQQGDTIGVVAPASHFDRDKYEKGLQIIKSLGYQIKEPQGVFDKKRYLAGEDDHRARLLHELFADADTKAIFCIRGGFGCMRMLPHLDFDEISSTPKILLGFSDISALLVALYQHCGLITFHGPSITTISETPDKILEDTWQLLTTGSCPTNHIAQGYAIHGGKATGPLVGGNLTTLCHLVGTPYELFAEGRLLFLEDLGEQPYRIDRMLSQMKMAGCFRGIKGLLLGAFTKCGDIEVIHEIVAEIFEAYHIPILTGLQCGHIPGNQTIPIGITATLDADHHTLEFAGPALKSSQNN